MFALVKRIILFLFLIVLCDRLSGSLFDFLEKEATGGKTQKQYCIANECVADILILGSSKALKDIDPAIVCDSLHMTCFNAGEGGHGIIPAFPRYEMIAERKKPRLVVYEVTPLYDYLDLNDESRYFSSITQYQEKKSVRYVIDKFSDSWEDIKNLSNLYQNNSHIVGNIFDIFISPKFDNGFEPVYGTFNPDLSDREYVHNNIKVDSLRLSYFEEMIQKIKRDRVLLLFVVSPFFESLESFDDYLPAVMLSEKYDIPLLNYSTLKGFTQNEIYFRDYKHLNRTGAKEYTKYIIKDIRKVLDSDD